MKKLLFIMMSALLIAGCSQTKLVEENNNETTNINEKESKKEIESYVIKGEVDMTDDYFSDANEMFKRNQYVALVEIKSIDGASNYSDMAQQYVYPYTYGKMKVLKSYKGGLMENETFDFTRMGGTLPFSEYVEGLGESRKEKVLANTDLKSSDFVTCLFENDILVEEGKVYLAYFDDDLDYREGMYTMSGHEGGLREVKELNGEIQVLNNYTNEYESIAKVLGVEE